MGYVLEGATEGVHLTQSDSHQLFGKKCLASRI